MLAYEFLDPGPLFHGFGKDWRVSDAAKFEYESSAVPDVAFASVVRTESRHWGWLGQFQLGSLVIDSTESSFEVVSASYWPPAGDTVNKIGMGGGWTWGVIESTCETVYYDDYVVMCAHGASYGRKSGDSGAPVFYWSGSGDEVTAYGIHFGADEGEQVSYFNSLSAIEQDLGTTIVYDYTPGPLTASISGPSIVDGTSWCQWWTNPSGGTPPYTYHWWGALSGSGSTVSGVVSDNDYLFLTVVDDDGESVSLSHQIAVIDEWDPCDI